MLLQPRRPFEYADKLLVNEQGMASDFTAPDGKGRVTVNDRTTPGNSVYNVTGDAFWGNAGTSPKLVRNSSGTLQWSPHNLVRQSQTFDSVTWGKSEATVSADAAIAPDGTLTADKIVESVNSASHLVNQSSTITTIVGQVNTYSFYAKAAERSWIAFDAQDNGGDKFAWFDLANGVVGTVQSPATSTITSVGNGWYRCTVTKAATDATVVFGGIFPAIVDNSLSYQGDGSSGFYVWGAQFNKGTTALSYTNMATTGSAKIGLGIDYDGTSYGLLVEPAATNLVIRNTEFDNATWDTPDCTVTANQTTAPDGTSAADLLTNDDAGPDLFNTFAITANATYTWSIFVKKTNQTWIRLSIKDDTAFTTNFVSGWFNLTTGVIGSIANGGTGSGATTSIQGLANGWYRCILTGAVGNGSTSADPALRITTGDNSETAQAGDTCYVWGAQLELGTVATSPIPTFAATVTRAVDKITKAVTAVPWSATAGTIYIKSIRRASAASLGYLPRYIQMEGSPTNENVIEFDLQNGVGELLDVVTANVSQASITLAAEVAVGSSIQTSGAWAANNFAGSVNGAAVVTDTSGTVPTVDTFHLGNREGDDRAINGWIYKMVWVPRRVIDADLPTWRYT